MKNELINLIRTYKTRIIVSIRSMNETSNSTLKAVKAQKLSCERKTLKELEILLNTKERNI